MKCDVFPKNTEMPGQKYTFLKRSLHWVSKNIKVRAIPATRDKLLWQKPKI